MDDLSHHDIGELSDVIRPLNSLEHLFWLSDQNRPVHFAVTAQVSGETSVRDWREALARLKRASLAAVCFCRGQAGRRSLVSSGEYRANTVEGRSRRSSVAVGSRGCRSWPRLRPEARAAVRAVFDPRHGQRRLHARGSPRNRRRHVARLCSPRHASRAQVPFEPLPSTPSLEEMLWWTVRRAGQLSPTGKAEALPGNPGIYRPRDKARPKVRGLCLTPAFTASLRVRSRQEATTVHGALCAALVNAGRRVPLGWQDVPVRILSPVNIRRLLGVGENCGFFVSATSSAFDLGVRDFGNSRGRQNRRRLRTDTGQR
jgi:hypothetical protein